MAHLTSKARLISELSRSRTSSPQEDEFATADSFDVHNDQIINSTIQMPDNTTQQQLPVDYNGYADHDPSEYGSEGSAEMSIELGRGIKRGARDAVDDASSNLVFNMGNDSQYEVTGTPPVRPEPNTRKSNDILRRQASVRRATDTTANNAAMHESGKSTKHRSLSEALAQMNADNEDSIMTEDFTQHTATATFNSRNSRFTRSRQVSSIQPAVSTRFTTNLRTDGTPRRQATNNPTVQSATFTANSYTIPELPNITELMAGVRNNGTPVFHRSSKPRTRFTSGNFKPRSNDYVPVSAISIPDDEKAIFASLQLLKDRVAELEMANSEAHKRAEEYEGEIIELRSQLQAERRRPDSALGSDDESRAQDKRRMEMTRLQAMVKTSQDRLDRSERKASVSDIALQRITKERDDLVTQIGVAYFNNEELKAENDVLRQQHAELEADYEDMERKLEYAAKETQHLKSQLVEAESRRAVPGSQRQRKGQEVKRHARTGQEPSKEQDLIHEPQLTKSRVAESSTTADRSHKPGRSVQMEERTARRTSSTLVEHPTERDIAFRIAREVQKHRDDARAAHAIDQATVDGDVASRPSSRPGQDRQDRNVRRLRSTRKASASMHDESDVSEEEPAAQLQVPRSLGEMVGAGEASKAKNAGPVLGDEDYTNLTEIDQDELDRLRRRIEDARRQRGKRNVSAPATSQHDETMRSTTFGATRKSSLKDITTGLVDGSGRDSSAEMAKIAKTVRVQSPQSTEDTTHQSSTELGDLSMPSNTSRRRRRAESAEGMTSAFILPDITLHSSVPPVVGIKLPVKHIPATCTSCHPDEDITIPSPIPVTDCELPQDVDVTTATVRPSQPPPLALAAVIKQIEDEIVHLKLHLQGQQQLYHQHNPAISKRRRLTVKERMDKLTAEIETRSNQVYALYDVLEGQKQANLRAKQNGTNVPEMEEREVEETLMSVGIDPAELSGRVGRGIPYVGLDGARDVSSDRESMDLPWEGLSDYESDEGH